MRMKAIGAAVALAALLSAGAQAANITSVVVTATPNDYTGPCPVLITFKAAVTLDGPGRVAYKWLRSDGAIDTATHTPLSFTGPSTLYATTTWTLGAAEPKFQPFNGWQKIALTLDAEVGGLAKAGYDLKKGHAVRVSDPFNFKINCQKGNTPPGGGQGKPDLIPALHNPMDGWVEVRNRGTAPAGPSKLFIKCAKDGVPDGHGCADLPPATAIPAPWFRVPDGIVLEVPNLAPGTGFPATAPFWAALSWKPGKYTFTAIADYTNVVVESNEGNNTTTSTLSK
jgi:CARDB